MKKVCLVWLCAGLILSSAFAQKKGNNYICIYARKYEFLFLVKL